MTRSLRTTLFKTLAVLCMNIVMTSTPLTAQMNFKARLQANSPAIITTPVSAIDKKYKITITGTYSMWSNQQGSGVDAVYVYSVPQEEINNARWPMQKKQDVDSYLQTSQPSAYQVFSLLPESNKEQIRALFPLVPQPTYVGDPTEYSIPPRISAGGINIFPSIKISMKKYVGFRIDNQPLNNLPYDAISHRYQTELSGTGKEFSLQILDSAYNVVQEKALGRYDDNSGYLDVTIEEISDKPQVNICSVDLVKNQQGKMVAIKLRAALLKKDTSSLSGVANSLFSPEQIGIVENGKFICPDSLVCGTSAGTPISVGFVFDRSGSMNGAITNNDITPRIIASQAALNSFVSKLRDKDQSFMYTFSDNYTLDVDWTLMNQAGKQNFTTVVNNINPEGSTAFNKTMLEALTKMESASNASRTLIALTDGINNLPPLSDLELINKARAFQGNLFVIGLGLSDADAQGVENLKRLAAAAPRGKYFAVNNAKSLDSAYAAILKETITDDCCALYFKVPECTSPKDSVRSLRLVYSSGDTVLFQTVEYKTDCASPITHIGDGNSGFIPTKDNPFGLDVVPNPITSYADFTFYTQVAGEVKLSVFSQQGKEVWNQTIGAARGYNSIEFNSEKLPSGTYFLSITHAGVTATKTITIIR